MSELLIQIKSRFLSWLIDYFVGHVWSIGTTDEILPFLSSFHCKCPSLACRRQWAVYHLVPIIKSRRVVHQSAPLPLCCLSPFGVIFISSKYSDFMLKYSLANFPVLLLFASVLWNQSSFPSCPHKTCAHKKS